jgi:DNA polymerase III epsilon subunit family exonuclease
MPDRLCALLVRRGGPLEIEHVATQLLRLRRCPERLQRRLVAEIVEGDARLAWLGRDLVGLAPGDRSHAELSATTFCVVDLETTGGSPGHSKVTEIGAVRVRGLAVAERFSTLVNPGRPIPPVVTRLTGIDDRMVAGSPDISIGLEEFVAFAGQDVLVAHNAPFDLRFLNYERRRLSGRYFTQAWLDTLLLARRLLAGRVARHDLGTLAAWADTRVRPSHRALPDAEATAELLVVLIGMLGERGVDTLTGAVAFAGTTGGHHSLKLALTEDLPRCPGVYVMRGRDGAPLYVGQAANLRRRVRAHFGPGGPPTRLVGRALDQLESIDHETCGSEFAALLREARLIKELRPSCNRRQAGGAARYLKLTGSSPAPRLSVVPRVRADAGSYFGPVRSQRLVRQAAACLRELFPLGDPDPVVRATTTAAIAAVLGGDPAALGDLGLRMGRAASQRGMAGGAAEVSDPARALLGTLAALARARRAAARFAVVVERGEWPAAAEVFFVAGGVVRHRVQLDWESWADESREGLAVLRRYSRSPSVPLAPEAMDEAAIVEERLQIGSAGGALVLAPGWRTVEVLEHIGRMVGRLAESAGDPDQALFDG